MNSEDLKLEISAYRVPGTRITVSTRGYGKWAVVHLSSVLARDGLGVGIIAQ